MLSMIIHLKTIFDDRLYLQSQCTDATDRSHDDALQHFHLMLINDAFQG